tara:strand:- start:1526 stop:1870 length:345 start_codon:yes stop_codon:yes gene_type:complete
VKEMKCPVCNKGKLEKKKVKEYMFGIYLGEFPAEICNSCNESFIDSINMKKIEKIAKQKGIWGLEMKTKIARTGNSLAVRIPKRIVDFLNLKEGESAYIHPEENKLVVETVKNQ